MPASPSLRSALSARSGAVRTGPRGIRLGLAAVLFASLLAAFAPAVGANAAPPPAPAGLEAVVGCVTADGTGGEPTTVYVDPGWLATVPDGSVITLHGSRADELNFFDAASGTWTGRPIDASSIGVPQCTGVKSGGTITDPHWAYCFNHNLNVCRTSVYQSVASLPVNRQVGTETPAFTNDTSPLTAERYTQLNWLAMHSGTGGPADREHLAFAVWCIANQIPDGASPGFEPYNGAYVPRTGGGKTTWDHCPIDLSQTKTPTNVFTNDGADRALSPAWKRLAANGDPSSPLNNNWAAVSLEQAAAGAPSVAIAGPSAPVAPGAPIPFTITLSTDQVNLDVPAGQRATLCADDTSGAVVEGRYLYFPNSGTENTARVCLDGQPTGSRATLGVSLVFLKPDAPSLSSGDPNCQGLIQMAETRLTADAIVEAPAVGSVKLHKHDRTDSAIPLAGAVFELRDADGATVATLTTDASGDASATGLAPGVYRLVETNAPSGYVLDPTVREVQVSGAGEASVDVANTRATSTGGFSVTKHVTGEGAGLIPAGTVYRVSYAYELDGAAVKGALMLADGASASVTGLPAGTVVTLSEEDPSSVEGVGYGAPVFTGGGVTPTADGATLTIGDATTISVALENPTMVPPVPSVPGTPGDTARPSAGPQPSLAETGTLVAGIAVPAIVLLLAGAGLIAVRRRRTTRR